MAPIHSYVPVGVHGPITRFGDLLPLPVGPADVLACGDLGRACQQRVSRCRKISQGVNGTARALNFQAGHEDESKWPSQCLNAAQTEALGNLRRVHAEDGFVCGESETSLSEMLKTSGGYAASAGELAAYRRGAASLPTGEEDPVPLPTVLSGEALEAVSDPLKNMFLSEEELAAVLQDTSVSGCYVDPVLEHDPFEYVFFFGAVVPIQNHPV